jgi:hypothetical protein
MKILQVEEIMFKSQGRFERRKHSKRRKNEKTRNSFIHYFKYRPQYLNFLDSSLTTSLNKKNTIMKEKQLHYCINKLRYEFF